MFIRKNWLMWLWGWWVQNLQRGLAGWWPTKANGAGLINRQFAGEFPLTQGRWSFCSVQAFSWLGGACPHVNPPSWYVKLTITHHIFTKGQELGCATLILNCIGSKILHEKNELKIKTYKLYKVVIISPFHHLVPFRIHFNI